MQYKENQLSLKEYQYLREAVNWTNYNAAQTEQALKKALCDVAVYDDSEEIVGMGRLVGDGLYCFMVDVVVVPDYQSKHIGSEIVRRLLQYVEDQTPEESRATVILIAAQEKEGFYEKFGFKKISPESCDSAMCMVINKANKPTI